MYPLVLSAIMTCSIYLLHAFMHRKQKPYVYLILFCALAAVDYVIDYTWKANASEYDLRTHLLLQSDNDHKEKKKKSRREVHEDYLTKCDEQLEYHKEQAVCCYNDVERLCNRLTSLEDKEKSLMILKSAFAAATPATPTFRIFAAAMLMLEQYFSDRWQEMQLMQVKLAQAQSHAEMYEHYRLTRKYVKDQIALEPKPSVKIIIGP